MSEMVGEEQELSPRPPTPPAATTNTNNVQTISNKSLFAGASDRNPLKNPIIIDIIKSFTLDTKEQLFALRQLSTSFYNNFCPIYLNQLNKTLYISSQDPSKSAELVTKIPREIAYIYREVVMDDLNFLCGGADEERVINSLQNIMPYIKKLDIFAKAQFRLMDFNYTKLIHFLKYFSFNGLFPRLEVLEIRHVNPYFYLRCYKDLFDTIPERIQVNLTFQTFQIFPEIIMEINSTKRLNVCSIAEDILINSTPMIEAFTRIFPVQEWIQSDKLKVKRLTLKISEIGDFYPNFDWRALDGIIRLTKCKGLNLDAHDPDTTSYPDFLSMPGEWKQQIERLYFHDYSYPLLGLQLFPNLKYLKIEICHSNAARLLYPNLRPKPARAKLRDVFRGLSNVNVEIDISRREWNRVRRILTKKRFNECIKSLVGEFKLEIV